MCIHILLHVILLVLPTLFNMSHSIYVNSYMLLFVITRYFMFFNNTVSMTLFLLLRLFTFLPVTVILHLFFVLVFLNPNTNPLSCMLLLTLRCCYFLLHLVSHYSTTSILLYRISIARSTLFKPFLRHFCASITCITVIMVLEFNSNHLVIL